MVVPDLIRTIDDSDKDVPDLSEESEEEEDFQPKKKIKKQKDFEKNFEFDFSTTNYGNQKDPWDDLAKYVKRKPNNKSYERIEKIRKEIKEAKRKDEVELLSDDEKDEEEGTDTDEQEGGDIKGAINDSDSDLSLSDDDLRKDFIRDKEKTIGKNKKKKLRKMQLEHVPETIDFEEVTPIEDVSFFEMNLSRPLLRAITAMGYVHPTPIQATTIPVALSGRDICGCAATGTGKTAAYVLPTLERLLYRPSVVSSVTRVLILVPTRELGVQVYQVAKQLAQFTRIDIGLAVGGLDLKAQESVLRKSPDIVIATPGRLIDHLKNTPSFSLDHVEVLILDEADRMLDEVFKEQMTEIIKQCARTRQTLLFSATMTEEVNELAAVSLTKPVKIFVDDNQTVASTLRQEFVKVRKEREADREAILASLLCRTFRDHVMVFVQTKKQAHRMYLLFGLLGLKVAELHGNLTQPQRLEALRKFREEEADILVATDVAARGLDIKGVKTVINFLLPATVEQYIHRVGRTGRTGRSGVSVTLAGEGERKMLKQIMKGSKSTLKCRVIAQEIITKYKKKVDGLEERIKQILQEEWEEKELRKAEAHMSKTEKILKGEVPDQREWFQTKKERQEEKARLRLEELHKFKKGKQKKESDKDAELAKTVKKSRPKKRKRKGELTAQERIEREMQKTALYQARVAKRKRKSSKLHAVNDDERKRKQGQIKNLKKKKSFFEKDLTDISKRSVKKLRYATQQHRNEQKYGRKDKQKKKKR